jgi:hypothetical protein
MFIVVVVLIGFTATVLHANDSRRQIKAPHTTRHEGSVMIITVNF